MNEQGKLLNVATRELPKDITNIIDLGGEVAMTGAVAVTDSPVHVADIENRGGYVPRSSELPGLCHIVSD